MSKSGEPKRARECQTESERARQSQRKPDRVRESQTESERARQSQRELNKGFIIKPERESERA